MPSLDSLDTFLLAGTEVCCSPFALFIQIQGFCICLLLALGWALASLVRRKEIRRIKENIKRGNNFAFICHDVNDLEHSSQVTLPRVSVVMPLKGFGEHNLHNWKTQITSLYGGPLEFLFVVDSTKDPAYHAVKHLLNDYKVPVQNYLRDVAGLSTKAIKGQMRMREIAAGLFQSDNVDAKIVIAGPSTTCSQKIHNQLVGVEKMHKDSKYVLFLDDDVRLHPGSIGALTAEMEKNPDIFIETGYPLDLPSGSLGSYCIYEYHMPCSMGFATGGKTFFLWGGCMMMHADDFRTDCHGVVSELRDGGYSDDMTLAAIAGAHKRLITSPPVAVFPHPLASDLNFARYWNYLRKQTFVLESYTTKVNWIMNRALFFTHFYLSWGFVAPYFMSGIHVAAAVRFYYKGCSADAAAFPFTGSEILHEQANWMKVFIAMLVDNFLYPISAIRSHFSQSIDWSGIQYHLKNGKISKIERSKGKGPKYTDLGGKHLYGKKGSPNNYSLLKSLSRSYVQWRQPKKYDL
ncbi:hypothetical protein OROMI_002522 [Orobanche minor]